QAVKREKRNAPASTESVTAVWRSLDRRRHPDAPQANGPEPSTGADPLTPEIIAASQPPASAFLPEARQAFLDRPLARQLLQLVKLGCARRRAAGNARRPRHRRRGLVDLSRGFCARSAGPVLRRRMARFAALELGQAGVGIVAGGDHGLHRLLALV